MADFDILFAGGGLASCLAALRLAQLRPKVRVGIVEAGRTLGGNHTWSSFDGDMTAEQRAWTAPLYTARWPGYSVAFPKVRRRIAMGYASATSERLDAAVREALPAAHILEGVSIVTLSADSVTLADQRRVTAGVVVDGRGQGGADALDLRWQKFVGLEVETVGPHGLAEPIIMDATVPQIDGYRFVYTLPLTASTLLIEDTYYSDGAELSNDQLRERIADYARSKGWEIARVIREERGILPIALGGDIDAVLAGEVPQIGLRAALFHPTTGYSFPDAVRTADLIAGLPVLDAASIGRAVQGASAESWRARGFYRMLNKMLFIAAAPEQRYRVLERFYGLGDGLIGRFYAGRSTLADKARILAGKPPVPLFAALKAVTA